MCSTIVNTEQSVDIENTDQPVDTNELAKSISQQHLTKWQSGILTADDLMIALPDACVDELHQALLRAGDVEIPDTSDRSRFKHCFAFTLEMQARLDGDGLGAVIVDRLPSERYNDQDNIRVCAMFSSFMGRLMEQNYAGMTLYDVKNTNAKNPEKVRKSITNHAQPYHTDGGWHRKPAHYVGLYCLRSARLGGGSRVTSMLNAFSSLLSYPETLQNLMQQHPWDMQGEHANGEIGVQLNPMFELLGDHFLSRYYDSYVRNGYAKIGNSLPVKLDRALLKLKEIIEAQPAIHFEMSSGQFQYLNNWTVLHGRESFADNASTSTNEARHVIRVWNH